MKAFGILHYVCWALFCFTHWASHPLLWFRGFPSHSFFSLWTTVPPNFLYPLKWYLSSTSFLLWHLENTLFSHYISPSLTWSLAFAISHSSFHTNFTASTLVMYFFTSTTSSGLDLRCYTDPFLCFSVPAFSFFVSVLVTY